MRKGVIFRLNCLQLTNIVVVPRSNVKAGLCTMLVVKKFTVVAAAAAVVIVKELIWMALF